jgi:hypothetical protein
MSAGAKIFLMWQTINGKISRMPCDWEKIFCALGKFTGRKNFRLQEYKAKKF